MSASTAIPEPPACHALAASSALRRAGVGSAPALVLGGAILLWGANWPVMKLGLGHVSPLWFSALRFATGAACLFAWQAARGAVWRPRARISPSLPPSACCR
jgi:drug/metabolite transporter (DMT)-like permease